MAFRPKAVLDLLKATFTEFSEDKAPRLGAALAYYTIFSIAPLLVITIAIVGFIFGEKAAAGGVFEQIDHLVGKQGAEAIQSMVKGAGEKKNTGLFASIMGFVVLLFGASGVFVQLKDALNTIWDVPDAKVEGGIKGFIKSRFLSFGLVLGVGFLLLVSLIISTILAALGKFAEGFITIGWLMNILNFAISFGVVTVLFAMIFKFLPDIKLTWRDVWLGAGITALLFALGKFAIGMYLGKASVTSAYGAAGSLVVLLIWIYYSAQILFLGAEFTQVYTRRHGSIFASEAAKQKAEKREPSSAAAGEGQGRRTESDGKRGTGVAGEGQAQPAPATAPAYSAPPATASLPAFAHRQGKVTSTVAKGISYAIFGLASLRMARREVGLEDPQASGASRTG